MSNRVAIITGASRGIGKEIALTLAKNSFNLAIIARNEEKLKALKKELSEYNVTVLPLSANLEDESAPDYIIGETINFFGKIDVLINNAGLALNKPIVENDCATWNKIFHINARAPHFLCQKAIPHLEKSDRPIIINMGSVVDHKGYINQGIYASSKHALAGFTSVLAKEVQSKNIRVHLISPGGVNTEMVSEVRPDLDTDNMIQPGEIGEIVLFLCNFKGKGTIDRIGIRRFNSTPFD